MRRLFLLLGVVAVLAGCGGGPRLGHVPNNTSARAVATPIRHPVVVPLRGAIDGTARLRRTDGGQKTSLLVTLKRARPDPLTVLLARGSCTRPTRIAPTTVLGRMSGTRASWTAPTPYAQLTAGPAAVVVRSKERPVAACGNIRRP